jgi:hypothetical protein
MGTRIVKYRIRTLYATAAQLALANPILLEGEPSTESDTGIKKIGNGITAYNSLPVESIAGSSGNVVGPAVSVDGRVALFNGTTGKLLKQSSAAPVLEGDSRLSDPRTPTAHNQAWSTITGTPTTLSGYGITNGFTEANVRATPLTGFASGAGTVAATDSVLAAIQKLNGNVAAAVAGSVTAVTGTAPIVSSGGTTPALSIGPATTSAAGSMSSADKTKIDSITVNSATVVRKLVRNNSGVTIAKGQAVYQTGSSGVTITVALADASAEATASQTLGLAQDAIADNATGYVIAVGELTGVNSSALTEGQILWLSETAGGLTTTRPTQPAHGVVLGYCVKQGPGASGILYVKVDNGLELNELHDVLVSSPSAGQVLRRASDGLWKNAILAAADMSGLATVATTGAYADLAGKPTLGTAAPLDVAATGDASGTQVVKGNDTRLSDPRTPTSHNQAFSTITGTPTTLSGYGITDAAPSSHVGSGGTAHANAVAAGAAGFMTGADKTKLDGVATGATANSSDAQLRDRSTHTGTQEVGTITGLGTLATQSGTFSGTSSGTNTGDQAITSTSDATSHTITLSASGGSLQLVEGANVTLTTTGTSGAAVLTIASTGGGGGGDAFRYFDAAEFIPRTTNGCGVSSDETATNRVNRDLLMFDAATQEFAQKWFAWPTGWTTFSVAFLWKYSSGSGNCVWGAQARLYADNTAVDTAFGTAQTVTDNGLGTAIHHESAATSAITPGGTVADGRPFVLQIYRDAANGSDTLSVDAELIGVILTKVT